MHLNVCFFDDISLRDIFTMDLVAPGSFPTIAVFIGKSLPFNLQVLNGSNDRHRGALGGNSTGFPTFIVCESHDANIS